MFKFIDTISLLLKEISENTSAICQLGIDIRQRQFSQPIPTSVAATLHRVQTQDAINHYKKHKDRIDRLVQAMADGCAPGAMIRGAPELWETGHWVWFLKGNS